MRYYAEQVGELLDRLRLDRVVLVPSMGGYVVFACLRLFREDLALLLAKPARAGPEETGGAPEMAAGRRRSVEVLPKLQMERLLAPDTLKNKKDVVESVHAMILESCPDGVVGALGAMRDRPDSTDLLGRIGVPTLVAGGEEDTLSTPEIMGEMTRKIPNSRHHTFSGAGHLSNLEAPEEFNAALIDFLAKI